MKIALQNCIFYFINLKNHLKIIMQRGIKKLGGKSTLPQFLGRKNTQTSFLGGKSIHTRRRRVGAY